MDAEEFASYYARYVVACIQAGVGPLPMAAARELLSAMLGANYS